MIFEINFNRKELEDDGMLELLGAKLVDTNSTKYPPFEIYEIEIPTFKELEELLKKIDEVKGNFHSAIISFDPPTIYLDNTI